MAVADARIIELPRVVDQRGNLTFIESAKHVPFEVKRVYYLYDVPGGESRGGHAHHKLEQFIIAASGSFTVQLHDGFDSKSVFLNRSYYGLFVPRMCWRVLEDFSSGSVCLVLASEPYEAEDYLRDFDEFVSLARRSP